VLGGKDSPELYREESVYHHVRGGEGKFTNWSPLPNSTNSSWVTFFFFSFSGGGGEFKDGVAGQWWRTPLIPALGRQRQADF
jgi:hypothetical protein